MSRGGGGGGAGRGVNMSRDDNGRSAGQPEYKHALVEMIQVAAPTVVTMTSYTLMQFVDGLMVSRIGPDKVYVAAQGNGGMAVWLAMAFALGLMTVINTFVSQNLGSGTPRRGAAYAWTGLWLAGIGAVLILPLAYWLPDVFALLKHERGSALFTMEVGYGRILIYGAFLTMGARAISHYFYGMHMPIVVMVATLTGNLVNVLANGVLIFGLAGARESMPFAWLFQTIAEALGVNAMGVSGAALGTVIGTSFELGIPMLVFLSPWLHAKYRTRSSWRPSLRCSRDILRLGWPGGLMFANEMICWGYLMAYLLPMGGQAAGEDPVIHNTAGWIALRYMHVSFMPAVGISIAVTALVGRCMGMRRPDLAASRAWLGLALTMGYMSLCALCFVLFREQMVGLFVPPDMAPAVVDELVRVGAKVMIAAAVFQVFDAIAITLSGALRGAGDTVWPGVVIVVLSWLCIVGLGHAMIELFPELGSLGPWIGASAYIILGGLAMLSRFLGGKWRRIELVKEDAGAALAGETPLSATEDAVAGTTPGVV